MATTKALLQAFFIIFSLTIVNIAVSEENDDHKGCEISTGCGEPEPEPTPGCSIVGTCDPEEDPNRNAIIFYSPGMFATVAKTCSVVCPLATDPDAQCTIVLNEETCTCECQDFEEPVTKKVLAETNNTLGELDNQDTLKGHERSIPDDWGETGYEFVIKGTGMSLMHFAQYDYDPADIREARRQSKEHDSGSRTFSYHNSRDHDVVIIRRSRSGSDRAHRVKPGQTSVVEIRKQDKVIVKEQGTTGRTIDEFHGYDIPRSWDWK